MLAAAVLTQHSSPFQRAALHAECRPYGFDPVRATPNPDPDPDPNPLRFYEPKYINISNP